MAEMISDLELLTSNSIHLSDTSDYEFFMIFKSEGKGQSCVHIFKPTTHLEMSNVNHICSGVKTVFVYVIFL